MHKCSLAGCVFTVKSGSNAFNDGMNEGLYPYKQTPE